VIVVLLAALDDSLSAMSSALATALVRPEYLARTSWLSVKQIFCGWIVVLAMYAFASATCNDWIRACLFNALPIGARYKSENVDAKTRPMTRSMELLPTDAIY
jgi:hypothetical protein